MQQTINQKILVCDCTENLRDAFLKLIKIILQASAKQRAGRTGRQMPGTVFRLYTESAHSTFLDNDLPEMCRIALHKVCLRVRAQDSAAQKPLATWLQEVIDPPHTITVDSSVRQLFEMGAIDVGEMLTKLGHCLNSISISPKYAKSILLGCYFNCLEPVVAIVVILSEG